MSDSEAKRRKRAHKELESLLKGHTISVESEGEDPVRAIINFLGLIDDPDAADIKIEWIVTERDTGIQHKLSLSSAELDEIAERDVAAMLKALRKPDRG